MNRVVQNYEIQHALGDGGMGTVYYARDVRLDRPVALKCLRPDVANRPGVLERFQREAKIQARLNHPNIAQIWDFFQSGAEWYLAMEYISGSNLSRVLRERGRLQFDEASNYAAQALRGLHHAHINLVFHRDVKPANLMLNSERQVKVTDFGIARVKDSSRQTREGMIVGTYEYISPEVAQGADATAASDVYSIGIVLFELITGRLPFDSQSEYELLRMHMNATRPSIRDFVRDVPSALSDVALRAMDKKPSKRFGSAEEMANELQRVLEPARGRSTPGVIERFFRRGDAAAEKTTSHTAVIEQRRRTAISRIEDLIDRNSFADALTEISNLARTDPDTPDLTNLRDRALRLNQQYELAVSNQAETARDLLKRGLPEDAQRVAEKALRMYPNAPELLNLERECRQRIDRSRSGSGVIPSIRQRVEEHIAVGDFQKATEFLLELLGTHENAADQIDLNKLLTRVHQARKDAERKAAIRKAAERAIAEARDLEVSTSLAAARERLARETEEVGRDPGLLQEIARIDVAIRAARRDASIARGISAASELVRERKWPDALKLLDQVEQSEGRDTRIDRIRAAAAAELQAHQAQVTRAAAEARSLMEAGRWEEAVLRLSAAVRDIPGEKSLTDLLQDAQRGLAQRRREETVARIKSDVDRYKSDKDYDEAIRVLLDAVSQYPEDKSLSSMLSQVTFERDSYVTATRVGQAIEQAEKLCREEEFDLAISTLREALAQLPGNPDLQRFLEQTEAARREFLRLAAVSEITIAVEVGLAAEIYEPAIQKLTLGLAGWPGDPELLELERLVRTSQRQTECRKALVAALEKGASLEREERWDEAAAVYGQTRSDFPETATDLDLRLEQARARAAEWRRNQRIAQADRSIQEWLDAGLLDEAEAEIDAAEKELPGEPAWRKWREALQDRRRLVLREASIGKTIEHARRLLGDLSFGEAENALAAAEKEWGTDARLSELQTAVRTARTGHEKAVESALARITALFEKRDWDGAISAANLNAAQFPREPRFAALLKEAKHNSAVEKRDNNLERRASQIDALLGEKAFDQAEVIIRAAIRDYPGESRFEDRRRGLETGRAAEALESEFRSAASQFERYCQQRQWEPARRAIAGFLQGAKAPQAQVLLDKLSERETHYNSRTRELETGAQSLIEAGDLASAQTLLRSASNEFPELTVFSRLDRDVTIRLAAEGKVRLIDAAEVSIRALIGEQLFDKALSEAEEALRKFPGEILFLDLRNRVTLRIQENAEIARFAESIRRKIAAGQGREAEKILIEGFRRYPGRPELEDLRAHVNAARQVEIDAERLRIQAEIEAEKLRIQTETEAEIHRIHAEAESERLRLQESERLRIQEEERVQREQAERRRLERERQAEDERRKQVLETEYRQALDQARILTSQQRIPEARALLTRFLDHAHTRDSAVVRLDGLLKKEAEEEERQRAIEESARQVDANSVVAPKTEAAAPARKRVPLFIAAGVVAAAVAIFAFVKTPHDSGPPPGREKPPPVVHAIRAQPGNLEFSWRSGDAAPGAKMLHVSTDSDSESWTIVSDDAWLRIAASGSAPRSAVSGMGSADLEVYVEPAGMTPGKYETVAALSSGDAQKTVRVRLMITMPAEIEQRPKNKKVEQAPAPSLLPPPPPPASVDCHAADYPGLSSGTLRWKGELGPGESLTIDKSTPSSGTLQGKLPGCAVSISVQPSSFDVREPSAASNYWQLRLVNRSGQTINAAQVDWKVR